MLSDMFWKWQSKLRHHVIYIPGLGDEKVSGQLLAVRLWRLYGVQGELYQMRWKERRHLDEKLEALVAKIDGYVAAGETVSLIAASAGASVALNAFAARKDVLAGVVLLSGKVHNPHEMHPSVVKDHIAFGHALERLPDVLVSLSTSDRAKILSTHGMVDTWVPPKDSYIEGSHMVSLPSSGHFFNIAFGLTIYAPLAMRFLKRQARLLAK